MTTPTDMSRWRLDDGLLQQLEAMAPRMAKALDLDQDMVDSSLASADCATDLTDILTTMFSVTLDPLFIEMVMEQLHADTFLLHFKRQDDVFATLELSAQGLTLSCQGLHLNTADDTASRFDAAGFHSLSRKTGVHALLVILMGLLPNPMPGIRMNVQRIQATHILKRVPTEGLVITPDFQAGITQLVTLLAATFPEDQDLPTRWQLLQSQHENAPLRLGTVRNMLSSTFGRDVQCKYKNGMVVELLFIQSLFPGEFQIQIQRNKVLLNLGFALLDSTGETNTLNTDKLDEALALPSWEDQADCLCNLTIAWHNHMPHNQVMPNATLVLNLISNCVQIV